jgi:rRNA-processing protein FCF1
MLHSKKSRASLVVIMDSSIIIDSLVCKVDLILEIGRVLSRAFTPTILSGTILEIENILRRSTGEKRRKQLTMALEIAKRFDKLDYNPLGDEEMDDVILRVARKIRAIVATDDGTLRKRLAKAGTPILFLRGKSHIEASGYPEGLEDPFPDSSDHYRYQRD